MKIKIYFLACLFLWACSKDSPVVPTSTGPHIAKGVFGLRDANKLTSLGAEYTRIIVWDTDIEAIYKEVDNGSSLQNNFYYQQVSSIFNAGIKVIVTVRWPDQNSTDPALYDRVPLGQDRMSSVALLNRFLIDFGPMIEVYSVQNEVGGLGPGSYLLSNMQSGPQGIPAIEWWKEIVYHVDSARNHHVTLNHLKISSPAPVLLKKLVFDNFGIPQTYEDFFYQTIDFGNQYCDFVDFHFNKFSLSEHDLALDFITPLVHVPMISTEWSEVNSAATYVQAEVSDSLRTQAVQHNYSIPPAPFTNGQLIEQMYSNPAPIGMWNYMVNESNYEENFMILSSKKLFDAGFKVACWNSGWQEGLTDYDLRAFYATKTVNSNQNEVSLLTIQFKDLE